MPLGEIMQEYNHGIIDRGLWIIDSALQIEVVFLAWTLYIRWREMNYYDADIQTSTAGLLVFNL